MRISDWSSDVCSSDLLLVEHLAHMHAAQSLVQRAAGEAERRRADCGAEDVEIAHGDLEALARFADQVASGYHAVAELEPAERTRRSEEHTSELQSLMRISYPVFCLTTKNKTHLNLLY